MAFFWHFVGAFLHLLALHEFFFWHFLALIWAFLGLFGTLWHFLALFANLLAPFGTFGGRGRRGGRGEEANDRPGNRFLLRNLAVRRSN